MQMKTAKDGLKRTQEAVGRQLGAMKSTLYEVGLYGPTVAEFPPEFLIEPGIPVAGCPDVDETGHVAL